MGTRKTQPINYAGMAQNVQNERKANNQPQPPVAVPEPAPAISEKKQSRPVSASNIFTAQMTFRASPEQRDFLKRLALDNHTTVGDIIRWYIDSLANGSIKYMG